jgi:hypothetical protein
MYSRNRRIRKPTKGDVMQTTTEAGSVTVPNNSRFDYVRYDDRATNVQGTLKTKFQEIEAYAEAFMESPRAKALFMTKLEEAYMWAGKAIRDDQVKRNGTTELQEQRTNQ